MKSKRKIKKSRSLADLRAWRILLAFYEDALKKERVIRALADAHKPFIKELNPLEHKVIWK